MLQLDDDQLYRALISRDARFDGVFFAGITSTRIYCRPVCRAQKPRAENCRYFANAAAAERRGFRPCLRCRPELAPGRPLGAARRVRDAASVDAMSRLAGLAASRIAAGALDRAGVDELAADLGVTGRHLRRAFTREMGASPVELAQTRRLLLAKQLLTDTALPVTLVALTSGFQSVRRFNTLFRERYRLTPSDVRRRQPESAEADVVSLSLAYRPPYDWPALLGHLEARATPSVEVVRDGHYWRTVRLDDVSGVVRVGPAGGEEDALRVQLSPSLLPVLVPLLARLRRLLDLDADPHAIGAHLGADEVLATRIAHRPGLRVAGAMHGFELALRTVLGQQVTVRGATTLAGRLTRLVGRPLAVGDALGLTHETVEAERLADASVELVMRIGLPRSRAACVLALARAVAEGALPELADDAPVDDPASFARRFVAIPGIGQWTAEYVAMRALRWPDAFPAGDLVLRRALGGISAARLRRESERWRPWRAYAAQHLWAAP